MHPRDVSGDEEAQRMRLSSSQGRATTPLMRKEPYSIRLDPAWREALEAHAEGQHRPLANLIEMIIGAWLAQAGPPPPKPGVGLSAKPAKKGRAR
jgi:hypothetical protein